MIKESDLHTQNSDLEIFHHRNCCLTNVAAGHDLSDQVIAFAKSPALGIASHTPRAWVVRRMILFTLRNLDGIRLGHTPDSTSRFKLRKEVANEDGGRVDER